MVTGPPDNPESNDNRNYIYDDDFHIRKEYPIVRDWIKEDSKIIDLGCGNGSLIRFILKKKNVYAQGIDISQSGIEICLKNNIQAKVGCIDKEETYKKYKKDEFDYTICNVTIQMVMCPEILLKEMKRISRFQIILFPNFAFILNRFDMLFLGRMPRFMLFGYNWYNTGHIHQLSIKDFKELCRKIDIRIIKEYHIGKAGPLIKVCPNLLSQVSIFLSTK
ncbi:SAM-dependent methyltransferase [groundwater metagenome]|uniref:SAM-dependent methyltransferase n=1 Tax=groundwater metagenome TaxID=717931 RepID=A0A098EFK2_9ZZZZ